MLRDVKCFGLSSFVLTRIHEFSEGSAGITEKGFLDGISGRSVCDLSSSFRKVR